MGKPNGQFDVCIGHLLKITTEKNKAKSTEQLTIKSFARATLQRQGLTRGYFKVTRSSETASVLKKNGKD